jgi:hypothetical protein
MATIGSAKATLVNKIDSLTSSATAKDTIFLAKALKENSSLNNFVWQGNWAATTAYAIDDVVASGGNTYMCKVAHTSGASFALGSDWDMMVSAGTNGTDGTDGTTVGTGTEGQLLTTSSGTIAWTDAPASGGMNGVQTFTSSGTWTKPAGVSKIRVQLVGSGHNGSNGGYGGGAGGYSEKFIDVSAITTESVTVGSPGGNTSSFGSHCSATGGSSYSGAHGGYGGIGSGGDINIRGGGGQCLDAGASGAGGASYFGGAGPGSMNTTDATLKSMTPYGGGGAGVYNGYTQGSASVGGVVIVWEYA